MAIQRLVENFILTPQNYKDYVQKRKITEADLKGISSGRLSESVKRYFEGHPIAMLEGKTVWRVPISRYDWKNANGRIYEKRLWENVIENQKDAYEGNNGLCDHPDDDKEGKFKEVSVVYLGLMLDEEKKLVLADCVFVGEQGHKAEEIMEVGGKIGFSSSGFGELSEADKSTVRWDSYQLERPADIVLNPSQKVFGTFDMKLDKNKESIVRESINEDKDEDEDELEDDNSKTTDIKDDKKNKRQENTMAGVTDIKMSKMELRKFKESITTYLGQLPQEDLYEKLKELQELKSYFSPGVEPSLLAEVEKQIAETEKAIEVAVKEHTKIANTFGVKSAEELKEGVKNLAIDTKLYERDAEDWRKITEGLQNKIKMLESVISTRPTVEAYKSLLIQMQTLKEKKEANEKKMVEYVKNLNTSISNHQSLEEQMVQELESISEENERLKKYSKQLKEYGLKMKSKLDTIKEERNRELAQIEANRIKEESVRFRPEGSVIDSFKGFSESDEVAQYYSDLEMRYGKDVKQYKENILNCKTLKEAMLVFTKIYSSVGASKLVKVSEALDPEERKRIIESATGTRIVKNTQLDSRLPATWE